MDMLEDFVGEALLVVSVELAKNDPRCGPAGALDAGSVGVLGGERRLAGEECWLLRRSIIRNVAMLRARLGDVQDG